MTQVVHPVAVCVGLLKTYTQQPEVRSDTSGSPCGIVCSCWMQVLWNYRAIFCLVPLITNKHLKTFGASLVLCHWQFCLLRDDVGRVHGSVAEGWSTYTHTHTHTPVIWYWLIKQIYRLLVMLEGFLLIRGHLKNKTNLSKKQRP